MNEVMKQLAEEIRAKAKAAIDFLAEDKAKEAATALDEAEGLQKKFDAHKRAYQLEQSTAQKGMNGKDGPPPPKGREGDESATGFALMAKCIRGQALDNVEAKSLALPSHLNPVEISKAMTTGGSSGEDYLIPEDVRTQIIELRRSYTSAKELVNVVPTTVLTGSQPIETSSYAGLVDFDDGDDVDDSGEPSFGNLTYTIHLKGMIIPVSNVLLATETANLMSYLDKFFTRNAIISENKAIFACLADDKTAVEITHIDDLTTSMNVDLDPSCLIDGVVVTNQTGFDRMTKYKDEMGRSLLVPDPSVRGGKMINDLPVKVFATALLPNVDGAAPVFYGSLKYGCTFMDLQYLFFASSAHANFRKNQTLLRVIEGFDVFQADSDAYCYGLIAEPVVEVETETETDTDG